MTFRSKKPIIEVKHLSKEYQIGMDRTYKRFTESFTNVVCHPIQTIRGLTEQKDTFWALRDINFEVEHGEVLGIIGRNGAGKSTLLKILSRITYPTEGEGIMRGRVGSLLEVGTGFHPELTGRENIYFNGAILGMKKREIDDNFDEIIRFSGVEPFLDTPVKRYSSGMQVRLAFSVAAHLEPEILLVDEVLAVGDAEFQKKCLGKMGEVAKEGRTILFVSHNMNAIEQLCSSTILLDNGKIVKKGTDVQSIISSYLFGDSTSNQQTSWVNKGIEFNNIFFKPLKIYLMDNEGKIRNNSLNNNEDIWIIIEGEIQEMDIALQVGFSLFNSEGNLICWSCHNDKSENMWPKMKIGFNRIRCQIPKRILNQGTYRLELIVALYYRCWICQPGKNAPSIVFDIQGGLSDSPYWIVKRPGIIAPVLDWDSI